MTVITAVLEAHPGREAELETALRKLVAQVAQEPGALEYTLHRAPDHASRFYFYERYRDQAAVDAHWPRLTSNTSSTASPSCVPRRRS